MSQNIFHNSTNCQNTTNSNNQNVWINCTAADDRAQLLAWLSPLDPGLRHCDIQERRVNDIGEWLIGTEEFRRWCGLGGERGGDKAVLFCYGNPGVGKTFISSLVVDRLCDRTRGQNTPVTCFYFDFAARKEQTATSMLGSLLKQIVNGTGGIPEDIWRALREQREAVSGRRPQLGDIVKMLQLITSSQRIYMVIDALDECTPVQRFRLFDSLKEILEKSPGARIFVTGRPHVRTEIETRLKGRVASVSVRPVRDDIIQFLQVRLSEDETPDAMDSSLEAEILDKIPENTSEMFLLASLNIESILQESTIYRRRERLNKMTDGLGLEDVYGATIVRIQAQGGDKPRLGMGALMWISHVERPLTPIELCQALAIDLGSTDFNASNIPSITTLVGCCQGLITMDKEASTGRLVHFTLREYLSAHPGIFGRPHSAIAELCLTYLNYQQVKDLSASSFAHLSAIIHDKPFLEYCSLYWGIHAKKEHSERAESLALQLLQDYDGHISAILLIRELLYHLPEGSNNLLFSGLHCASHFGIIGVVASLIAMGGYDLNEGDSCERTALSFAAMQGHEDVVKILLEREEVNPNKPNYYGATPVLSAALRGHEGVVKMLLEREEATPDNPNQNGVTPLMSAASKGHEGVVKILLEHEGVNPDKSDHNGKTPLSHAAEGGYPGVVKILLEREEVNPDKPDNYGATPLMSAVEKGHEGVAKILLEREEVNPDKPNNYGATPLMSAAKKGHEEVVKILLVREEVNPNKPDRFGRTPLTLATLSCRQSVIALLRSRKAITHSWE